MAVYRPKYRDPRNKETEAVPALFFLTVVWSLVRRLEGNIFLACLLLHGARRAPELQAYDAGGCIPFGELFEILHV